MDDLTALAEGMKGMRERANADIDGFEAAGGPYETGVLMGQRRCTGTHLNYRSVT